jgi:transketolase
MRKTFARLSYEIQSNDESAFVLLGDIGVHSFQESFRDFGSRTFNIGILEQTMIGLASGLAMSGKIPIVHTIAPFLVERCYEQIKVDFGYQKLHGNLVSVGASFDYGALGSTHHCPGDVGILSNIPGLEIVLPGTKGEFEKLLLENYKSSNCTYYRLSEHENSETFDLKIGEGKRVREGVSASILVVGPILDLVLESTSGLDVEILYFNSVVPLDEELLRSSCKSGKILIVEPYYSGSLSVQVLRILKGQSIQLVNLGVSREFPEIYGSSKAIYESLGLSGVRIRDELMELING